MGNLSQKQKHCQNKNQMVKCDVKSQSKVSKAPQPINYVDQIKQIKNSNHQQFLKELAQIYKDLPKLEQHKSLIQDIGRHDISYFQKHISFHHVSRINQQILNSHDDDEFPQQIRCPIVNFSVKPFSAQEYSDEIGEVVQGKTHLISKCQTLLTFFYCHDLYNLKIINLNSCNLSNIQFCSVVHAETIRDLELMDNHIRNLSPLIKGNFKSLKKLNVANNPIKYCESISRLNMQHRHFSLLLNKKGYYYYNKQQKQTPVIIAQDLSQICKLSTQLSFGVTVTAMCDYRIFQSNRTKNIFLY